MRRPRIAGLCGAAALALSLGLAGCGGGGDSSGGSPESAGQEQVDSQKKAVIDELVGELEATGDVTPTQIACLKDGFNGFSLEELTLLRDSEEGTEVPADVQDRILTIVTGCVLGESASPAAS